MRAVRAHVSIPLAVKLSPLYTSLPHFARRIESEGADALVLFNRFYEPDIDVRNQQVVRALTLSSSAELLPRLHALAIVSGCTRLALGVTGGVHTGLDALKAVMCGADGVQMVSALLTEGPEHLEAVRAQGFDERFVRIWTFYLAYCEAAFDTGNTDVVQFTLRKPLP